MQEGGRAAGDSAPPSCTMVFCRRETAARGSAVGLGQGPTARRVCQAMKMDAGCDGAIAGGRGVGAPIMEEERKWIWV